MLGLTESSNPASTREDDGITVGPTSSLHLSYGLYPKLQDLFSPSLCLSFFQPFLRSELHFVVSESVVCTVLPY